MKTSLTIPLLLALALAGPSRADTLELRDGSLLKGTYQGGTQATVRFEVAGQVMTVPAAKILALTFDSRPDAAAGGADASAANAGAAAPAEVGTASSPPAAPARVTVPGGTALLVRMSEALSSSQHEAGHRFTAVLEAPLTVGNALVAPKGAMVYGQITQAQSAGRVAGQAEMKIELTDVVLGQVRQPIRTSEAAGASDKQGRDTAGKVVRGAAIGGLIDGSDGAKTGAKVGAGVAILTRGAKVEVPAGTLLEFRILAPFEAAVAGQAPAEAAPTPPASAGATLPAGTALLVRFRDSIDSRQHKTGHRFTTVLETPLTIGEQVVAPKGTLVYGRLDSSTSAGRLRGRSELSLSLTDIVVDGRSLSMRTGDYEAQGESQGRDTAGRVARGAVIGGLLDGKKGARTGAKVGAGVSLLTRGNQIQIPAGTLIEFRLRDPLTF